MSLKKSTRYLQSFFASKFKKGVNKPTVLSYLLTNQCNSHCIMCSVWKNYDNSTIDANALTTALKNPLFSEIKHVGISGGEPSLCDDLYQQVEALIDGIKHLQSISITSNCINYDFWEHHLKDLFLLCKQKDVYFQLNISIDGIGKIHDIIRGTKGIFENTNKVVELAKNGNIPFQIQSTVSKYNIYHLGRILNYAIENGGDVIFRLASPISRLDNIHQLKNIELNKKELSFFCDFLRSPLLYNHTKSPGRKLFYRKLAEQLLGEDRRLAPCIFKKEGIVLASDGSLSYCSRFETPFSDFSNPLAFNSFRDRKCFAKCENHSCDYCYHDQSGLWSPKEIIKLYISPMLNKPLKVWRVLSNLTQATINRPRLSKGDIVTNVGIIGMYGGGHVGDAAILGGVICRLIKQHPTATHFYVYSFRKDRTECWVSNLERLSNVISIEVVGDEADFENRLKNSQLLVWAGGPIMEIPVILTKHYRLIRKVLHFGGRFEIEGVGYGPLNGRYGKTIANRIFKSASRISVRSKQDAAVIQLIGCETYGDKHDPAFDYLKLLEGQKLIIEPHRKKIIDDIVGDNPYMALNLRPLWSRYGNDDSFNYEIFIGEVVRVIDALADKGLKTIFFPMNADQFGFSDLMVGYEIEKKISTSSHFIVWETEPTIEEVVYMLRKAKMSLCMRYHAVIFSQSQHIPTFGIDYSLDGKGKVSTLLKEEYCFDLRSFNCEQIAKRLELCLKN